METEVQKPKKVPKVPEPGTPAWREYNRERKRRSRGNIAAKEQEQQLAELKQRDPVAWSIQQTWAEVLSKPITKPGVPLPDPGPARLPTLAEWLKCLKQINTAAAQEEIVRVEAALASGRTEFPRGGA